jgi:hypothetical protein
MAALACDNNVQLLPTVKQAIIFIPWRSDSMKVNSYTDNQFCMTIYHVQSTHPQKLIAGIYAQNMLAPFYNKYRNILQQVRTEIYV